MAYLQLSNQTTNTCDYEVKLGNNFNTTYYNGLRITGRNYGQSTSSVSSYVEDRTATSNYSSNYVRGEVDNGLSAGRSYELYAYAQAKNGTWYLAGSDTITMKSESSDTKVLTMPAGINCNWNQKHVGVTKLFGGGACTLVAGLDVANFYAKNGEGYTPANMTSYWSSAGYNWGTPGPGKIAGKVQGDQAKLLALIKSEIDAGHPCVVTIGKSGNPSHTLFAYGYKNGAAEYADIFVYDPANMTTSDITGRVVDLHNAMDYNHDYFNIYCVRTTYSN